MSKGFNIVIVVILVIIAIGILFIAFKPSSTDNGEVQKAKVTYSILKENTVTSPEISNYLSFVYNCQDINNEIQCEGTANFIGANDYEIFGVSLSLYCYKEYEGTKQCTINTDSFDLGTMDKTRNQLPFQVKCNYGSNQDFKVKIGFRDGITVYPMEC